MKKNFNISSVLTQLLLLLFVIIWIIPTFGLFVSSLRDKDLLAISGWWTSLTTTEINEIHRMAGMEKQIQENKTEITEDENSKKTSQATINPRKRKKRGTELTLDD